MVNDPDRNQTNGPAPSGQLYRAARLTIDRRAMFFIADYHVLIGLGNASELRRLTYDVAACWLAAGLDPEDVIFYRLRRNACVTRAKCIVRVSRRSESC